MLNMFTPTEWEKTTTDIADEPERQQRIELDRIGVAGASAGGHLAASAATLFDAPEGRTGHALDDTSARPDFVALLYPVITMRGPFAHEASRRSLLGEAPSDDLVKRWGRYRPSTRLRAR